VPIGLRHGGAGAGAFLGAGPLSFSASPPRESKTRTPAAACASSAATTRRDSTSRPAP